MRKINRKCVICGKDYSYCVSCSEDMNKPTWMTSFCCENHRNIYNACAAYTANLKTAQEARIELDKCDLSHKDSFRESVKNVIKEIYDNSQVEQPKEVQQEESSVVSIEPKVETNNNKIKYEQQKPAFKPKNKKNR